LQRIVGPRGDTDELGFRGAFEIGAAETKRPLEAAVLIQDDARGYQRRPGQMVGEPVSLVAVLGEIQHAHHPCWRRCRTITAAKSGSRLAANTVSVWPTTQSTSPAIHCCKPRPMAAATVPLRMATARGA